MRLGDERVGAVLADVRVVDVEELVEDCELRPGLTQRDRAGDTDGERGLC